jgi:hypothetical protein
MVNLYSLLYIRSVLSIGSDRDRDSVRRPPVRPGSRADGSLRPAARRAPFRIRGAIGSGIIARLRGRTEGMRITGAAVKPRDRPSATPLHSKTSPRRNVTTPNAAFDFLSLPTCNENTPPRIRLCALRRSHSYRAKFIPHLAASRSSIASRIPAMTLDLFFRKRKWGK